MNLRLAAILLICLLNTHSFSQKKSKPKNPCQDAMSQGEINMCTRRGFEQADAELLRVVEKVKFEVKGYEGAAITFQIAQEKWLAYRDATCESEAIIYMGGSIRPTILNTCLTSVTLERTQRLKAFLSEMNQ